MMTLGQALGARFFRYPGTPKRLRFRFVPMRALIASPAARIGDGEASYVDRAKSGLQSMLTAWQQTSASLHEFVWGTSSALATGVVAPAEAKDPNLAREYVADQMLQYAQVYQWPTEAVQSRVAAMRNVGAGATVVATLERCASFGPDVNWPAAKGWYDLTTEIMRTASLVNAAETGENLRIEAGYLWDKAVAAAKAAADATKAASAAVLQRVDKVTDTISKTASGAATGVGLGLVVLGAAAGAVFFWPEIAALTAINKRRS